MDANFLLYLIEGTIKYVQVQFPTLTTNSSRLPQVLQELDTNLKLLKNCCSVDGDLKTSSQVLIEEVLEVDPNQKELEQLRKYNRRNVAEIMQIVRSNFPNHNIVVEQEIHDLRRLFDNPNVRPADRDASLIVLACQLGLTGQKPIVLTSDHDFHIPIKYLMAQNTISILGNSYPTNQLVYRDYYLFIRRMHDCCNLSTERYSPLAYEYHSALVNRVLNLRKQDVIKRTIVYLGKMWDIHTISILYKGV